MPEVRLDEHINLRGRNRPTLHPALAELISAHAEARQLRDQFLERRARIHQRAQCHVSADAGERIQVEYSLRHKASE